MALLGQPGASRKLWTLLKPEGLLTGVSSAGRGAGSPVGPGGSEQMGTGIR